MSYADADLFPKRLELLEQAIPRSSRVGVLWNPANASTAPQLKTTHAAAEALGLTVFSVALLTSYGSDFIAMFHRGASLVDRILEGAEPADLPVEQPTKFEFVVNLKTAKAPGLTIPPSLLARANQVLE